MLDFPLVRLDLREREILLRIAPHLVRPLEFLLPFYDEGLFARWRLRVGMWLYDALSYDKSLPRHRSLSAAEVRALEPSLEPRGLEGRRRPTTTPRRRCPSGCAWRTFWTRGRTAR